MTEDTVANYITGISGNMKDGFLIRNVNDARAKVDVKKQWKGAPADRAVIELYDGIKVDEIALTKDNNWEHSFLDLPKYNHETGKEIKYTAAEQPLPGYETTVTGNEHDGFVFTNLIVGKRNINVSKTWVGPKADKVKISLLANGERISSVELSEENGWHHEFKDLEKCDREGREIKYTVTEEAVPNYETAISGDMNVGFVVKNTNTEKTKVAVSKVWEGKKGSKAEIELLAGGRRIDGVTLNDANGWKHEFTDLPKYDPVTGKTVVYTVKEKEIPGYKATIKGNAEDGFVVTNKEDVIETGDSEDPALFSIALFSALLLAVAIVRRKENDPNGNIEDSLKEI